MEFAIRLEGVPDLTIPLVRSSSSSSVTVSRRIQHYYCNDCDDNYNEFLQYCNICGSNLITIYYPDNDNIIENNVENNHRDLLNNLFEFLGTDLREEIENAMNNANNNDNKSISQTYLDTLGKVILDKRQGLLYDITIKIGPFRVMSIPASFGPISTTLITSEIIKGIPEYGENELENNVKDKIVLLKRGVVSFAFKAMSSQKAGCKALIIGQSSDIWPFVMSDSANEIDNFKLEIPILMISKKDYVIIEKMLNAKDSNENSTNTTFDCHIICGDKKTECSICQEEMVENEVIYKLTCRHSYHQQCVTSWLTNHNTCPLCRLELPKEENKKTTRRTTPENDHRLPYFR